MRVVLTGANRGLGLEFARQLAAAGHEVAATARSLDSASELGALASEHAGLTAHTCDVASDDSVAQFATEVGSRFSALDLVINNAGSNEHRAGLDGLEFETPRDVLKLRAALEKMTAEDRDGTFIVLRDGERLEFKTRPRSLAADVRKPGPWLQLSHQLAGMPHRIASLVRCKPPAKNNNKCDVMHDGAQKQRVPY